MKIFQPVLLQQNKRLQNVYGKVLLVFHRYHFCAISNHTHHVKACSSFSFFYKHESDNKNPAWRTLNFTPTPKGKSSPHVVSLIPKMTDVRKPGRNLFRVPHRKIRIWLFNCVMCDVFFCFSEFLVKSDTQRWQLKGFSDSLEREWRTQQVWFI